MRTKEDIATALQNITHLTIRDWFAGQALAAIAVWVLPPSGRRPNETEAAKQAYAYADAMLAARSSDTKGEG